MRKTLIALGVLAASAGASLAAPVRFCKDGVHSANPAINLVTTGCVSAGGDGFYSNAGGGDPEAKVEQAILHANGNVVDLMLYGKSDANPGFFTFMPADPATAQSGTWSVNDGTLISYITVKASSGFALYELAAPASSGTFSTLGLLTPSGNQPNVSHISFWTTDPGSPPVPEPSTLALLAAPIALAVFRRRR